MTQINQQTTQTFATKQTYNSKSGINTRKVIIVWGVFTLIAITLTILSWRGWQFPLALFLEGSTYLGLWVLISLGCWYFIKRWSFSAVLGKGIDLLEIPVYLNFTGLVLISLFGIAPYLDRTHLIPLVDTPIDLPRGLLLIGVGYVAMWGGYAITVGTLKARAFQRNVYPTTSLNFDNPSLSRAMGLYFFIVFLKLVVFHIYQINLGGLRQPVFFFLETSWLLLALFIIQTALGRWPRSVLVIMLTCEAFIVILSGWSSALLKIMFILIAGFAYTGKRVPYTLLLAGCLAGFVLTPVTRSMRTADSSSADAVISAVTMSVDRYWYSAQEGVSANQELLIRRQSATAQLPGFMLRLTPSVIPYRSTSELLSIPISFIPRALWPNKLKSGEKGTTFAEEYLGLDGSSAAATTLAGSSYMYGGWTVMIIMMGLAGIIFAITYYLIMVPALNSSQVGLMALYAGLIMANFHLGEGDIAGMWQGLIQRTFVFFCCLVILCINRSTNANVSQK